MLEPKDAPAAPVVETDPTPDQLGLGPAGPPSVVERLEALLDRLDALRDRPAALVIGLACAAAAVAVVVASRSQPTSIAVEDLIPQVTLTPTSTPGIEPADVVVHVSGAVDKPGVYVLPPTARVVDAVGAAGGAVPDADLHQLNLAALVVDGQRVYVPTAGEVVTLPRGPSDGSPGGPIELNRADVTALQTLPGVGPATAEAIVRHRDDNGPFRTVDDLLDVPGIGPAKLAAIAELVVVRP